MAFLTFLSLFCLAAACLRLRAVRAGHADLVRVVRLAAAEQRAIALSLFGRGADGALGFLGRRLLDMSDHLTARTEQPDTKLLLEKEDLAVRPVVDFAVAQVCAQLEPGRRAWRVAASLDGVRLHADRRALNQVFVAVLSGAAAATRDQDWIEISLEDGAGGPVIVVQDEGVGLPLPPDAHGADVPAAGARGIGLHLTLASRLMRAHGGSLRVESAERVGTRVRLVF